MRTPRRWYRRAAPTVIDHLLAPAAALWAVATRAREWRRSELDPGPPVICIGNATAGGSAKTPLVREITARLVQAGTAPHILSRGHGGRLIGPLRVDPGRHTAQEVGDEPLMLVAEAPVWVARRRPLGAAAAARAGAAVIVMDDGLQTPGVRKRLSILAVDGETRAGEWPFGNGRTLPAGPLREPLGRALARVDLVAVVLPPDLEDADPELLRLFPTHPVLVARLEPLAPPPEGRQLAFAGIAKPWRFERALRAAGCQVADFVPLGDHARIPMAELVVRAAALRADLITTEKDWVRLGPEDRAKVAFWPVRARFLDEAALDRALAAALGR